MNYTKPFAAASIVLGLASTLTFAAGPAAITLNMPFGQSSVLAWSWGASNSGSTHVGGGGGAGKANFQDLSLVRNTDSQSPQFLDAVAKGTHVTFAEIQNGNQLIRLEEVMVTSYSAGGSADSKAAPTENITLNFAKIRYSVNGIPFCFNIAENAGC
jgi:type VI secretion system secreted protein Hcp